MSGETTPLAARLRAVVAVLGKQVKVARQIGVSQAALSNYARGAKHPPPDVLKHLAAKANVRLEWLREGRGPFFEGETVSGGDRDAAALTDGALVDLLHRHLSAHPDFAELVVAELRRAGAGVGHDGGGRPAAPPGDEHRPGMSLRRPQGGAVVPANDYENMLPELRDQFAPIIGSVAAGLAFQWNESDFPPKTAGEYVRVRGEAPGGFAMWVEGESMEPELRNGSIALFGGRIQPDDEETQGKPALVVYEDDSARLRYAVKMISAGKTTVRMSPLNATAFPDMEIPRQHLHALYAVIGPVTS